MNKVIIKVDILYLVIKLIGVVIKYWILPIVVHDFLSKFIIIDFNLFYAIFFMFGILKIISVLQYPPKHEVRI